MQPKTGAMTRAITLAAVLGLALGMTMANTGQAEGTHKGYEMPPYTVDWSDGPRELRSYGPHILAEVRVAGGRSGAIQTGFSLLAGYIFGGNAAGEKIAMTVPVAQTPEADHWVVSFMMPARFTKDTLPAPRDARISFIQAPASRQVVERFSGLPETTDLASRAETLRTWATAQGHDIIAGPHFYFYDAPMSLPWNRRNEVAFTIR
jgi:hypothetical protein